MIKVSISHFRKNLSEFLRLIELGLETEIVIFRYNKEVARIVLPKRERKSILGCAAKDFPDFKYNDIKKGFEDIPELFGY